MKLYPVEFFENDLLLHGLSTESLVPYQSRLLIAAELYLGLALILGVFLKWTIRLSLVMLFGYTAWLAILISKEGNIGNCGCFGDIIQMTPLQAIIKNIVLIALLIPLLKWPPVAQFKFQRAGAIGCFVISTSLPFILSPVFFTTPTIYNAEGRPQMKIFEIGADSSQVASYLEGKKIIAFFLSGCEHCRLAATRMEAIKKSNTNMPVFAVIQYSSEDSMKEFLAKSKMSFPYATTPDLTAMIRVAGSDYPIIYYVNDGFIEKSLSMYDLNEKDIKLWLNQ
jgi:thiol-disulfide isomerase/thioredoxin